MKNFLNPPRKIDRRDPLHSVQPAEVMRKRTEKNRVFLSCETFEALKYEILRCSNAGDYSVVVSGWLDESTVEYFVRLGYEVEVDGSKVFVSWEHNVE